MLALPADHHLRARYPRGLNGSYGPDHVVPDHGSGRALCGRRVMTRGFKRWPPTTNARIRQDETCVACWRKVERMTAAA